MRDFIPASILVLCPAEIFVALTQGGNSWRSQNEMAGLGPECPALTWKKGHVATRSSYLCL